jgi:hypothetical protein
MKPVSVRSIRRCFPPSSRPQFPETPSLLRLFRFCRISPCGQGGRVASTKRSTPPPTPTASVGKPGPQPMQLGMSKTTIEIQP